MTSEFMVDFSDLPLRQSENLFTHQRRYRHSIQSSRGLSWLALSRLAIPWRCCKDRVMRCRRRNSVLPYQALPRYVGFAASPKPWSALSEWFLCA